LDSANKHILRDKHSLATPLLLIIVDELGTEALDWETEILWEEMDRMASDIPSTNKDKVSALALAMTTDRFYTDTNTFNSICSAIGGSDFPVNFKMFDVPTLEEIIWSVHEVLLHEPISRGENLGDRFHTNVRVFMKVAISSYGFLDAPQPLEFLSLGELPDVGQLDKPMMDAIYANEKFRRETIEEYITFRYLHLIEQLKVVKLVHGKTDGLIKQINAMMRK